MTHNRKQTTNRRGRWFADPRLQCGMLVRTILYWLYSVCGIGAIALTCIVFARHPRTPAEWMDQLWLNCGPLVLGSILILPLVLLDCLRFSQRFAGPMVRFRRTLHELANGEPTQAIELREGDFWCEFARDLNLLAQRLENDSADAGTPPATNDGRPQPSHSAPISPAVTDSGQALTELPTSLTTM